MLSLLKQEKRKGFRMRRTVARSPTCHRRLNQSNDSSDSSLSGEPAAACCPNSRLASKSGASMVIKSSAVIFAPPADRAMRLAWRNRTRSNALRIERVFKKCGNNFRAAMRRPSAYRPLALNL